MMKKLVIGTRGSDLALWQTNFVAKKIKRYFPQIEIETKIIKTKGDQILDKALDKINGKGLFTKALENELLSGEIDLAVHSLKDLPTYLPKGLILAAVTERHSPEDVIISKKKHLAIKRFSKKATIATGSLRRKAQLLYIRKDLNVVDVRGNVNTRIKKFLESDWEAMILARAGVERLDLDEYISSIIDVKEMVPAVGQGALGIEAKADNSELQIIMKKINHINTEIETKAERAFLKRLGGSCKTPIAAYAKIKNNRLFLDGLVSTEDGKQYFRSATAGNINNPEKIGINLAESVLKMGAKTIIKKIT